MGIRRAGATCLSGALEDEPRRCWSAAQLLSVAPPPALPVPLSLQSMGVFTTGGGEGVSLRPGNKVTEAEGWREGGWIGHWDESAAFKATPSSFYTLKREFQNYFDISLTCDRRNDTPGTDTAPPAGLV